LRLKGFYEVSQVLYEWYLEQGIAKELARIVLPVGIYTEFYWTVNFRSLMNFLTLRDDPHAQFEIQEYARAIKKLIYDIDKIPITLEAYKEYGR
jgi:thymidylate synthase (FAD)